MRKSALGLLANETTVEIGALREDGVLLGASALLMTRELGLSLAGLPTEADELDDAAGATDGGRLESRDISA
jgi:hypothetical protein